MATIMAAPFQNIIDNHNRLINEGPLLGAARGIFGDDVFVVHKFGFNPDVLSSSATIWDRGGLYPWQTSAELLDVVSDDINDTMGGTGAQTVSIQGLDVDYNRQTEIVELSGTTIVQTTKKFFRVFRMSIPPLVDADGNSIAGQNNAIGTITASIGATVQAQIVNGNNQTLMALLTVPAGFTAFLLHGSAGTGSGKEATVKYFVRPYLGVFNLGYIVQLFENNEQRPFSIPQAINEKSDIDVRAISGVVGTAVSANFDVVFVRNPE